VPESPGYYGSAAPSISPFLIFAAVGVGLFFLLK